MPFVLVSTALVTLWCESLYEDIVSTGFVDDSLDERSGCL